VARKALARNAGARGLRAILENAMLDVMYEVPSNKGIREVVITVEVIDRGERPLMVYEKEAELA
jgi:ATP-dependent Clp protease ATP-binding subunit ClpX